MDSRQYRAAMQAVIPHRFPQSRRAAAAALCIVLALTGCASSGGVGETLGKAMGKTKAMVGIAPANAAPAEKSIPLRLYAGDNLNAADDGKALAVVVRVYQLRGLQRFEDTPFDDFLDVTRERQALGEELIAVREILLMPGQRHEVIEQMAAQANHLGVVALFRAPARSRWRFAFDTTDAATRDGVTVGLHACAMSTPSPALATRLSGDSHSLSSVNCSTP